MRKSVIAGTHQLLEEEWLEIERVASVQVTSEQPDFPIESAFGPAQGPGWRAASAGPQLIRVVFDHPRSLRRIQLRFSETEIARTQEFTLRWVASPTRAAKEIVRQQWNFSPQGSTSEIEDYQVDLTGVSVLELSLKPDLSDANAVASLASFRIV